jgi:hypothetical protein
MGVSGQRHAPGKRPPVPIVQEAGWASEPVWTQRLEEKSFPSYQDPYKMCRTERGSEPRGDKQTNKQTADRITNKHSMTQHRAAQSRMLRRDWRETASLYQTHTPKLLAKLAVSQPVTVAADTVRGTLLRTSLCLVPG